MGEVGDLDAALVDRSAACSVDGWRSDNDGLDSVRVGSLNDLVDVSMYSRIR